MSTVKKYRYREPCEAIQYWSDESSKRAIKELCGDDVTFNAFGARIRTFNNGTVTVRSSEWIVKDDGFLKRYNSFDFDEIFEAVPQ